MQTDKLQDTPEDLAKSREVALKACRSLMDSLGAWHEIIQEHPVLSRDDKEFLIHLLNEAKISRNRLELLLNKPADSKEAIVSANFCLVVEPSTLRVICFKEKLDSTGGSKYSYTLAGTDELLEQAVFCNPEVGKKIIESLASEVEFSGTNFVLLSDLQYLSLRIHAIMETIINRVTDPLKQGGHYAY